MTLRSIYATREEIPEEYRETGLFEERNGQFQMARIDGLSTAADVERLQGATRAEREAHAATKALLLPFSKMGDATEVQAILDSIPELKASQGQIDDDKMKELVQAKANSLLLPVERQLAEAKEQFALANDQIAKYQKKEASVTIRGELSKVAKSANVSDSAIGDVTMYEHFFTIDDSGTVVAKEGTGIPAGTTPEIWLGDIKKDKAHWWPASAGGGAGGGGSKGNGDNPFAEKTLNITEQGRIFREDPTRARMLAKAVGKTI